MDKEHGETLREICTELERRHDLRQGFFADLLELSDWGYVIQCHALLEAALSDAVTNSLGNPKLRKIFDHVPLSDARIGKAEFAKALGIISDSQAKFIRHCSELRNSLVHNIGNANFSFADHIAGLDAKQLDSWCNRIAGSTTHGMSEEIGILARKRPRVALWFATVVFLYEVLPLT